MTLSLFKVGPFPVLTEMFLNFKKKVVKSIGKGFTLFSQMLI